MNKDKKNGHRLFLEAGLSQWPVRTHEQTNSKIYYHKHAAESRKKPEGKNVS